MASKLKRIRQLLGVGRVSLGFLFESPAVFDPDLMIPIVEQVLAGWSAASPGPKRSFSLSIPETLARRLVAVDGSLLRALPQIVSAASRIGHTRLWPNGP